MIYWEKALKQSTERNAEDVFCALQATASLYNELRDAAMKEEISEEHRMMLFRHCAAQVDDLKRYYELVLISAGLVVKIRNHILEGSI